MATITDGGRRLTGDVDVFGGYDGRYGVLLMTEMIGWYSLDRSLHGVQHDPVPLAEALSIADGYFKRLKPHYQGAEEALAETVFGFSRSQRDHMEICIHAPDHISVTVELPASLERGFIDRFFRHGRREQRLHSRSALATILRTYFTAPEELLGRDIWRDQ